MTISVRHHLAAAATLAAGLAITALSAHAAPIEYTGSLGSLAPPISFEVIGVNLNVTPANIGLADVMNPADILTGVGFTLPMNYATLSLGSAVLSNGSSAFFDPQGQPAGAGNNLATGNEGLTGSGGLIKNSVDFILDGLLAGFEPFTDSSDVVFQYGTALNEPNFAGTCTSNCSPTPDQQAAAVPEPASLVLIGTALVGFGLLRRRKA